ncbi:MAG: formate--tetrahydrofolate ligase [Akkermansiaceae bacterium]|jgi:formate--tetrahydrofolate ligase|nr:formate--tetrahydrofolate ligase [Akkermansiaceae bacterium]
MSQVTDLEIARAATPLPITQIGENLGIPDEELECYGRLKAKISRRFMDSLEGRPDGKLILVTAMSPPPAGGGKTTTSVGLHDALCRLGKKSIVCLREPSLGPCFGMKGGAAGGGRSQVIPMEDINLHFTGDFHAIAAANNLLAAVIDNYIHHGNEVRLDLRRITWRRVLDMNDRALRSINIGLGGPSNGFPRESGFDIVPASEVMAIFCLAESMDDLKARLDRVVVGQTRGGDLVRAAEFGVSGAMAVLLKDALQPNLVQTIEKNPAIIHGGPFANIAHGCNSVIATRTALKLADYVVTEAGFGADLGAEKFCDIKCRQAGLRPAAAVVVATLPALRYHGGASVKALHRPDPDAVRRGLPNLMRHLSNLHDHFGLRRVVALNRFASDTAEEIELVMEAGRQAGVGIVSATHWAEGGAGAEDLARAVIRAAEGPDDFRFLYPDDLPLREKLEVVAKKIYGAASVSTHVSIDRQLRELEEQGFGHLPVCIAKTQFSFSTDPAAIGLADGHTLKVREVRLSAGAGFVVMICGDIMTLPGLPKHPAALGIDLGPDGQICGLS